MQEFIPVTNSNGQFLAAGYFTPGPSAAQNEIRNDKKVAFSIEPVLVNQPGSLLPFTTDFLDTDTLSLAIGNIDTPPTGGNYSLQIGAVIDAGLLNLAYNISATALQSALNVALTAEGSPLCTVVLSTSNSGVYSITGASNGAIASGLFSVTATSLLYPISTVFFIEGTLGSATTPYQLTLVLRQQPMCYAEPTTLLTTADVAIATTQAGDGTHNHIQVISFNVAQVYDGAYTINAVANSVTTSCGNATPLMTAQQLGLLLATHPQINYQTSGFVDNIKVTQQGQTWTVEFIGTLKNSNANTLTVLNSTQNPLVGPRGLSGFIYYNTIGLYQYSITQSGNSFKLKRQIQRVRATGEVQTLYVGDVTIYKDLIDAATAVPTPIASYFTSTQSDARYLRSNDDSTLAMGNTLTIDNGATLSFQAGATIDLYSTAVTQRTGTGKWVLSIGSVLSEASVTPKGTTYTIDGAITIQSGVAWIEKTSIIALTLAAPSSQDDTRITIISNSDFAHVVTFTGVTLLDGTTGANITATFAAFKGASITVVAKGAFWFTESFNAVTIA